jgi:CHAD domain-containing protein
MTPLQWKQIILTRYQKLLINSKKMAPDFESEPIHRFRVAYKQLRAFLRVSGHFAIEENKIKISGKSKNIYRLTGQVRDGQLQLELVNKVATELSLQPTGYLGVLQDAIHNHMMKLAAIPIEAAIKRIRKKTIKNLQVKGNRILPGRYISEKETALAALLKVKKFTDSRLHQIRKTLKDLFYIQNVHTKSNPGEFPNLTKNKKKIILEVLHLLGKNQDYNTVISSIRTFLTGHPKSKDSKPLELIIKKLRMEKSVIRYLLLSHLKYAQDLLTLKPASPQTGLK